MEKLGEAKQVRLEAAGGLRMIAELQLKIVESAVSLKMSEISTKAAVENNVEDGDPVWLWTLPNGVSTGDAAVVGDYFCRLVIENTEDYVNVNYMKILKNMIAELDKLTVSIVGVHSSIEA